MKKYFSLKKPLKVILDIIYWITLITLIIGIPCSVVFLTVKPSSFPYIIDIKSIIFTFIDDIILMLIVNELRKVMDRIIKSTPFTLENVRGFRKVSLYVIIAGVINLVNSIIYNNFNLFKFDNITGLLKIDIISFIIVAGILSVIAEVLEKAVRLKEENDLTV